MNEHMSGDRRPGPQRGSARLPVHTTVLLASAMATPIVIGAGSLLLDPAAAVVLAVVVVLVLAGVVRWAVGRSSLT